MNNQLQEINLDNLSPSSDETTTTTTEREVIDGVEIPQNEQDYLDMANHFKDLIEEKENEVREFKIKYLKYKKILSKIYGLFETARDVIEETAEIQGDPQYETLFGAIDDILNETLFGNEVKKLGLIESRPPRHLIFEVMNN